MKECWLGAGKPAATLAQRSNKLRMAMLFGKRIMFDALHVHDVRGVGLFSGKRFRLDGQMRRKIQVLVCGAGHRHDWVRLDSALKIKSCDDIMGFD